MDMSSSYTASKSSFCLILSIALVAIHFMTFINSAFAKTGSSSRYPAGRPAYRRVANTNDARDFQEIKYLLFISAGGGYASSSAKDLGFDSSLKGYSLQGSLLGSLQYSAFVFDLGIGWLYSSISGDRDPVPTGSPQLVSATVTTRTGLVHLSPRYRILPQWEVGPYAEVLFGARAPFAQGLLTSQDSFPVFLGLKTLYDFDTNKLHWRAGIQAGTDLTLKDRQVFLAMAVIELGIDLFGGNQRQSVRVEEKIVVKEVLNFAFDDEIIHFELDSDQLDAPSRQFVQALARYLASNTSQWESLTVEGHTDSRGSVEYNQELSERRAATVKSLLTTEGIEESRMAVKGYGPTQPIDDREIQEAWSVNRRVEIDFAGVSDAKTFREGLRRLKAKYSRKR